MATRGMKYWERLADAINREPIFERDRFFLSMLAPLGIEKGKPFKPSARQKKILEQAVLVGEAMAKANGFAKRMKDVDTRCLIQNKQKIADNRNLIRTQRSGAPISD